VCANVERKETRSIPKPEWWASNAGDGTKQVSTFNDGHDLTFIIGLAHSDGCIQGHPFMASRANSHCPKEDVDCRHSQFYLSRLSVGLGGRAACRRNEMGSIPNHHPRDDAGLTLRDA
jgi:hypothetical protein